MSVLAYDINDHPFPAFFPKHGGSSAVAINAAETENAPVFIDVLAGEHEFVDQATAVFIYVDINVRLTVDASDSSYPTEESMAEEWFIPAGRLFPLQMIYPQRSRLWVCAASAEDTGVLHVNVIDHAK